MNQMTFLNPSQDAPMTWTPTRQEANKRLQHFLPKAGAHYARRRNFDLGPSDRGSVSALSPWLRYRVLCEEEVVRAVLERHSASSSEKFLQEVFWRGYFKGWLEHRPDVWIRYKTRLVELAGQLDKDRSLRQRYETAIQGKTGIDCFDAWTKELVEHGYLHNHARMWFASIWIFTLELPWELGADVFLRHLLDGDPASNTCSWRWVGGLHTKGKTYLARADNIQAFTEGRFHPYGDLALESLALDDGDLPALRAIAPSQAVPNEGRVGLILTEEDCSPESLPLPSAPAAVLVLRAPTEKSLWPTSNAVKAFVSGAVTEAASRAETAFSSPTKISDNEQWATAVAEWVSAHRFDTIVTPRLPVGPVRKRLLAATDGVDCPLVEVTRFYDEIVWPHTKKGFFALKKQIPTIVEQLQWS